MEYQQLKKSVNDAKKERDRAQVNLDDFKQSNLSNDALNDGYNEGRLKELDKEHEYRETVYNSCLTQRQEFEKSNKDLIISWESTLKQHIHQEMDEGQVNFEQDKAAEISRSNAALQQWAKAYQDKHKTKPTLYIQSDVEGVLLGNKKSKILKINPRFVHTVKQMQKHARVILDINSIMVGEQSFGSKERHNEFYKNLKDLVQNEKILQVSVGTIYQDGKPAKWSGTYAEWQKAGFKGSEELYNAANGDGNKGREYTKDAIALVLMMYRRDVLNEDVKEYRNFFVDNTLQHVEKFDGINHTGKSVKGTYIRKYFQDLKIKPFHTVGIRNYIDYMGVTQPTGQMLKQGTNWQDPNIRDIFRDFNQNTLVAQAHGVNGEGTGTLSEINDSGTLHNLPLAFVQKERKVDMQLAQHNMTLPGVVHDDYNSIKDMALNYDPFNLNEIFNGEELQKITSYFQEQWKEGKTHTIDDIKLLLKMVNLGANVADKKGITPLISAVQHGQKDLVERLLKIDGIDVNKQDNDKCSPLMHATINGQQELIKLLKAKSAVLDVADSAGETALLYATCNEKLDRAKKILEIDGIDVNARDKHGYTALMWAALRGTEDVVELLIKKGADVRAKNRFNATPLTLAQELKSGTEKDKIVKVLEAQQQNLMQLNNIKELSNTTAQRNKIQINALQNNYFNHSLQPQSNELTGIKKRMFDNQISHIGGVNKIKDSRALHNLPLAFVQKEQELDKRKEDVSKQNKVDDVMKLIEDTTLGDGLISADTYNKIRELVKDGHEIEWSALTPAQMERVKKTVISRWQSNTTHDAYDVAIIRSIPGISVNLPDPNGIMMPSIVANILQSSTGSNNEMYRLSNIGRLSRKNAQDKINALQNNYFNHSLQQKNDVLPDKEKKLLEVTIANTNGGDVNKILSDDGETLLSACVEVGDWRAAQYLIHTKRAQIPTDKKAVEKLKQSIIQCKVTLDKPASSDDRNWKLYHDYNGTAAIPMIEKFIKDTKLVLNSSADITTFLDDKDYESLSLHLQGNNISDFNLLRLFYPHKGGDVPIERLKNMNNESYNEIIQIPQVANLIDKYNLKHKPVDLPQRSQAKSRVMLRPIANNANVTNNNQSATSNVGGAAKVNNANVANNQKQVVNRKFNIDRLTNILLQDNVSNSQNAGQKINQAQSSNGVASQQKNIKQPLPPLTKVKGGQKDQALKDEWFKAFENESLSVDELQALIDKGCDANWQNKNKGNALHTTVLMNFKSDSDVIEFLINKGANVNAQDNEGKTPLHYVKNFGTTECLIKSGADVNAQDNEGNTPLHMQIHYAKSNVIDLFLKAGANVDLLNKKQKSALDSEYIKQRYEIWKKAKSIKEPVTNVQVQSEMFFDKRNNLAPASVVKRPDGVQASKHGQRLGQSRAGKGMWF